MAAGCAQGPLPARPPTNDPERARQHSEGHGQTIVASRLLDLEGTLLELILAARRRRVERAATLSQPRVIGRLVCSPPCLASGCTLMQI